MKSIKLYLTINSLFSGTSGVIMLLLSNILNQFFSISNPYIFPIIGANLLFFAAFVWFVSVKQLHNKLIVIIISSLDALWVIGSIIIVAFGLFNLSTNGYVLITIVAIWIAFLGYKQFQYIKNK